MHLDTAAGAEGQQRDTGTAGEHKARRDTGACPPLPVPQSPCNIACPLRNLQSSFGITPAPL